jgi:hypothetical protein
MLVNFKYYEGVGVPPNMDHLDVSQIPIGGNGHLPPGQKVLPGVLNSSENTRSQVSPVSNEVCV